MCLVPPSCCYRTALADLPEDMKIPDAEMPKVFKFIELAKMTMDFNSKWVPFHDYQKLYDSKCSPWVSVEERLPKDGEAVIFAHATGVSSGIYFSFGGNEPFEELDGYTYTATHWMPLPAPPEAE